MKHDEIIYSLLELDHKEVKIVDYEDSDKRIPIYYQGEEKKL